MIETRAPVRDADMLGGDDWRARTKHGDGRRAGDRRALVEVEIAHTTAAAAAGGTRGRVQHGGRGDDAWWSVRLEHEAITARARDWSRGRRRASGRWRASRSEIELECVEMRGLVGLETSVLVEGDLEVSIRVDTHEVAFVVLVLVDLHRTAKVIREHRLEFRVR